jgi:DNA-binding transcriptional ArsR family regulator
MSRNEQLLKTLTPSTLKVYNYILKHNPKEVTITEIANNLKLTKPTIYHHLEKLKNANLIKETPTGYKAEKRVHINIMKHYAIIMFGKEIPRETLTATIFGIELGFILALPIPTEIKIALTFLCVLGLINSIRQILANIS